MSHQFFMQRRQYPVARAPLLVAPALLLVKLR